MSATTKTKAGLFAALRARSAAELEKPGQRAAFRLWNLAALLLSSLGMTVLSLALAIGTYDVEEFYGYFTNPQILLLNWLPILLLQALLWLLCGRQWLAFLLTAVPVLGASVGDFYKIKFRFEPFTFADMDSIVAGLNVAGDYGLTLNSRVLAAALYALLGTPLLALLARGRARGKARWLALLVLLASLVPLWKGVFTNRRLYYDNAYRNAYIGDLTAQQNFIANGFVYPFLYSIGENRDLPPEGYDEAAARALLARYEDADIPADRAVNVLVLQLESFTDLGRVGFSDIDPAAYEGLRQLEAESISGTLVANVIGGGTINTERCFLSGSSELLSYGRDADSYVRYFNDQGYFTTGGHPNRPDFYNRVNVARYLGFQEYLFNDYYGDITDNRWNCDAAFLPEAVRLFRERAAAGERIFSFNVTLQGHGPYRAGDANDPRRYWLGSGVSREAEDQLQTYLALEAETQRLVLEQLELLREEPYPVVVLLYGDHNPSFIPATVYDECGVSFDLNKGEDFLRYYGTPYCIWANKAAREQLGNDFVGQGPTVSPGYLMSVLFDSLGWQGSAFMQLTEEIRGELPVLHKNGCYFENGAYTLALSEQGQRLLSDYQNAQYLLHDLRRVKQER